MSFEPRESTPTVVTLENFAIGMPTVEFAPLSGGVLQPYVNLGVVNDAALQKAIETIEMFDGSPGIQSQILQLVTKVSPSFKVGVFNWGVDTLRFALGGATVTDEKITTTSDPLDFLFLAHDAVNAAGTVVTPATNTAENVGTGDGTKGAISGDYSLKYKINAIGDVTSVTVAGVSYAPVTVATTGNQVVILTGTGATSGDMQFFTGAAVATNVTGQILATYTPSFTLTEGIAAPDDYTMDRKLGRIRVIHEATKATGSQPIIAGQAVFVDYTYNKKAKNTFQPFTQNSFVGSARIKLRSDQGVNFVWNIPSAQILVADDDLTFAVDDFMVNNVTLTALDAGGSDRFGTFEHYTKTQAGN